MALSKNYLKYIKSTAWFDLRAEVFERDDYECQSCSSNSSNLQCHHLNYNRLFNEDLSDLITTCDTCHKYHDRIRKLVSKMKGVKRDIAEELLIEYGYPHNFPKDRDILKSLHHNLKKLKRMNLEEVVING